MSKFPIPVFIPARDMTEAKEIADAVTILVNNTDKEDLIRVCRAIQKKPGLIKKALKYI